MPTYIGLVNYTDRGIRNVKGSPDRLEAVKNLAKDLGDELKQFFLTMGEYDIVVVYELPDDAAAAKFNMTIGSVGAVRTNTLKAFTEDEYRDIIAALPA